MRAYMGAQAQAAAQAREILEVARAILRRRLPYAYGLLMTLPPVVTPGLGTVAVTDGGAFLWDPAAILRWDRVDGVESIAAALAHETLHVFLRHGERRGNRDPQRWNIAADLYINGILRECGFKLPAGCLYPDQYGLPDGLTADEYYDRLPPDVGSGAQGGAGAPGAPDDSGPSGDRREGSGDPDAGSDAGAGGDGDGDTGDRPVPGCGHCGGCAGNPLPGEPQGDGPIVDGDGDEISPPSDAEISEAVRRMAREIEQAGKDRGSVPSGLARVAAEILEPPRLSWRELLRRHASTALAKAGRGRRTYRRMGHAYWSMRAGMGSRAPAIPSREARISRVWIAVDTSASMSADDLGYAMVEIGEAIRAARGGEIYVISCDANADDPVRVRDLDEATRALKGGGGTSFDPVFRRADRAHEKNEPCRPDLIVYVTDGYGDSPAPRSAYGVIWLVTPHGQRPASWGEVVRVDGGRDG